MLSLYAVNITWPTRNHPASSTGRTTVIGYYVHHQGSGHLHRALAVQQAADVPLCGLSTAAAPAGWTGDWVSLPDDADDEPGPDPSAGGRLHYVPLGCDGLSRRMALVSAWLDAVRPAALVVDVSVEVALLARLHGVPVLVVAQPGRRYDPGHRLAYDIASTIIAPWPEQVGGLWGATADDLAKTRYVGAIGRFAPTAEPTAAHGRRKVLVLNGTGGAGPAPGDIDAARAATADRGWEWVHLDRAHGTWRADPWPELCGATVVVSHAGQNAIAEIAAARRPVLVLPQDRPFGEQHVMAAALQEAGYPVEVRPGWPAPADWPALLDRLAARDTTSWSSWNDGKGALRMVDLFRELVSPDEEEVPPCVP